MSGDGQRDTVRGGNREPKVEGLKRYGNDWVLGDSQSREVRETKLSFGLLLFDSISGNMFQGTPDITIEEFDAEPVKTPSGYFAFNNVPAEFDTVHVTVDVGEEYFTEERTVVLAPDRADYDPDDPEVHVVDDRTTGVRMEFTPTPSYPFDYNQTHVRGHVYAPDGTPLRDATVSMPEFDVETWTVDEGEYALHVPLKSKNVHKTNGKQYVKLNGASNGNGNGTNGHIGTNGHLDDPTIEVSHPDYDDYSTTVQMEAGIRTVHHITLE